MNEIYQKGMAQVFKALAEVNALGAFRDAMGAMAEATSRAMLNLNLDARQIDQMRGQLSLCYRLADDAGRALAERRGNANAAPPPGFPAAP